MIDGIGTLIPSEQSNRYGDIAGEERRSYTGDTSRLLLSWEMLQEN